MSTDTVNMAANFQDYIAVKNTLSLYCVALDTKDFGLFSEVFTSDADTKYPFEGGNLTGVDAIAAAISQRYARALRQEKQTADNSVDWHP